MQRKRRIPFATRIRVAIGNRRGTEHRSRGIQDRRLTVRCVGVTLCDRAGGGGDGGHRVLMVAMEINQRSVCTSGFADDRFVNVAGVDVSERWSRRSAADWIVRDRLLFHLHIDLRATRPGSRDSASQGIVLESHVRRPVGIDVDEQA